MLVKLQRSVVTIRSTVMCAGLQKAKKSIPEYGKLQTLVRKTGSGNVTFQIQKVDSGWVGRTVSRKTPIPEEGNGVLGSPSLYPEWKEGGLPTVRRRYVCFRSVALMNFELDVVEDCMFTCCLGSEINQDRTICGGTANLYREASTSSTGMDAGAKKGARLPQPIHRRRRAK